MFISAVIDNGSSSAPMLIVDYPSRVTELPEEAFLASKVLTGTVSNVDEDELTFVVEDDDAEFGETVVTFPRSRLRMTDESGVSRGAMVLIGLPADSAGEAKQLRVFVMPGREISERQLREGSAWASRIS